MGTLNILKSAYLFRHDAVIEKLLCAKVIFL